MHCGWQPWSPYITSHTTLLAQQLWGYNRGRPRRAFFVLFINDLIKLARKLQVGRIPVVAPRVGADEWHCPLDQVEGKNGLQNVFTQSVLQHSRHDHQHDRNNGEVVWEMCIWAVSSLTTVASHCCTYIDQDVLYFQIYFVCQKECRNFFILYVEKTFWSCTRVIHTKWLRVLGERC